MTQPNIPPNPLVANTTGLEGDEELILGDVTMRLMYGNEGGTMRPFLRSAESRNLEDDAMPDARLGMMIYPHFVC